MPASFEEIYDDHVWHVYGFLAYRTGSRTEAEDLTQETFERAVKAFGRFDPTRASPKTWLLAIATNVLIDTHRRKAVRPSEATDPSVLADLAPGSEGAPNLGVSPELEAALATLTVRDREIVALRYGGDLTGPEIAALLGLTLANVQQILSRSLRRLRVELERDAQRT